jgi:hypothetical protein
VACGPPEIPHPSPWLGSWLNERDVRTVTGARFLLPKGSEFRVDHVFGLGIRRCGAAVRTAIRRIRRREVGTAPGPAHLYRRLLADPCPVLLLTTW